MPPTLILLLILATDFALMLTNRVWADVAVLGIAFGVILLLNVGV